MVHKKTLRLVPLGGLGEIGMNCMLLEWEGKCVLIDCGVQFPDQSYPGVDILLPDFSYLRERLDSLLGILVTHGHDDHIGAIPYLAMERDIDVYCTPFPQGLINQKLEEFSGLHEIRFHTVEPRKKFKVGPFTVDPVEVQHSIIEALGLVIETPMGTIVHSGDFKHDPFLANRPNNGFDAFTQAGKKGVKLLLSDSTNAEREGHTISEYDVQNNFEKFIEYQSGRLIIALFASNIKRIETILSLAYRYGKKIALVGRSMHSYTRIAHYQNSLKIPEDTLILAEHSGRYPDDKVIFLATGSQAEPQSALLKISHGTHKDVKLKKSDTVIMSSRFIPGNERAISAMIDHLYRQGADVLYEAIHQIHVSGHGFQEELLMMLEANRPEYFVPVHGEYRHLAKHAKLAARAGVDPRNVFVVENGQVMELGKDGLRLAEQLTLMKQAVVGKQLIHGQPEDFKLRQKMSKAGVVFVVVLRKTKTHKLLSPVRVMPYGVLPHDGEAMEVLVEEIESALTHSARQAAQKREIDLEEQLRLETRRHFKRIATIKPLVIPLIFDL